MSTQSRASRLWTTYRSNLEELSVCLPTYLSVVSAMQCLCRVTQAAPALQEQGKNNSCLTGTAQHGTALAVPSFVRPVCLVSTYIEIS